MCGRYALTLPPDAMRALFRYAEQPNFPPRYNIAPTQPVPVVLEEKGERHFRLMRWGFLPGWVKDPKDFPLVINIRGETMREKPSFRAAFIRRRCLMPADGFYEWSRSATENRAFLFRRPDRGLFAFAALHETWSSADGSEIDTVALVNGPANGLMSAIHERCPVILDPAQYARWLDPETTPDAAYGLLRPPAEDLLEMVRIGPAVNKVANDEASVQAPFDAAIHGVVQVKEKSKPASKPPSPRTTDGGGGQGNLF
jgi:putative SOS response-associated peptidase YedK